MKRFSFARKGFTLIELLIVMVIIGILAAVMMLSGGAATAQAEGTAIVNDIRALKSATMMFYTKIVGLSETDIDDVFAGTEVESRPEFNGKTGTQLLGIFTSSPKKFVGSSSIYKFIRDATDKSVWYVGADVSFRNKDTRNYIEGLAAEASLLGTSDCTTKPEPASESDYKAATHKCVWIRAR